MIVRPSIALSDFSGSAKGVTARSVRGRTVLSAKSQHSSITTPAQAASRSDLSRISRSYKQLSDSQMKGWETLAGHLKGISTFGKAAVTVKAVVDSMGIYLMLRERHREEQQVRTVETVVEKEVNILRWWQTALMWLGGVSLIGILTMAIGKVLISRFKQR